MKVRNASVKWYYGAALMAILMLTPVMFFWPRQHTSHKKNPYASIRKAHVHLDHSGFFPDAFDKPQDVTKACIKCHDSEAKDFMKTSHWTWDRGPVKIPGRDLTLKIGKKNLINNFCIGIEGNEAGCTSCHAGYGWDYNSPPPTKEEDIDCLVCHDWSGTYAKGPKGMPRKGVNLQVSAQSVGYPKRENCGTCHIYGGGGMGVKHGDIDDSLVNPAEVVDAHMGKHSLLCVDCHQTSHHEIKGQAYSVSVSANEKALDCTDCHDVAPHESQRLNEHVSAVACQTCHIPNFAKKEPTKMWWDWSKAGNPNRKEDHLTYLKIKGEFVYEKKVQPEYAWFNRSVNRYLAGDVIDPKKETSLNQPRGDIHDPTARIWPFKIHRATQPYDKKNKYLMIPTTSGAGGFWHDFNWQKALRLAGKNTPLEYSGSYGFAKTRMYWPLSHMVAPKEKTLQCSDCHGEQATRFNWQELGYSGDPAETGGRISQNLVEFSAKANTNKQGGK